MKSKKKSKYSNLNGLKAVQKLQSRNDKVIADADKSRDVVILDIADYAKEEERQKLNNKENYRKINYDSTTANNETIHEVISRF